MSSSIITEQLNATVSLSDGTVFTLANADIIGNVTVSSQCVSSSGFEFGSVCASTLSMNFKSNLTNRYQLVGATVQLILYKNGIWQNFGLFNVTSASRWRNTFTISASDNMIWLDKSIYSTDENSHKINEITTRMNASVTIFRALQIIVQEIGNLELAQNQADIEMLPNGDLSTIIFQDITTDCPRDWLSWVSEFLCGFAIANETGKITIRQFENTPTAVVTQKMVQTETTDIADFTLALVGARMEVWDTSMGAVWYPDIENAPNSIFLDVSNNWLIQGKHYLYKTAMDILGNMTSVIGNIPYRPFTVTVHSNEVYHVGQCIQIQDVDGNYYNSIITHHTWTLYGGQIIKCAGEDTRLLAETKRRSQLKRAEERLTTKINNLSVDVQSEDEIKLLAKEGSLITGTTYYDISGDDNI